MMGKRKARLSVVALLSHNAIECDGASAGASDTGIPQGFAKALVAMLGSDDVEAKERETVAVLHHRNRAYGFLIDKSHHEAAGVGSVERLDVLASGVPAL